MALVLPRASAASVGTGGRRRGVRLPDAGDVPQVRVAGDPGLRDPDFARFAGGLGDIGAGLSDLGEGLRRREEAQQREIEKQQKRHDATKTTEALLSFEREAMDEFRRRQTEDDPARPSFLRDFEGDLDQRLEKGVAGLEGVSEEATERLRLRLQSSLQGIVDSAGRLSLQAGQERASDAIGAVVNQLSAQAARDPDFLSAILGEAGDRLGEFKGSLTADQERDQLLKARQQIILGAIAGFVRAERFQDAELLLASGEFDEDLSRAQRASAEAMIESGERQAVTDAEKAEADAEKALKEARGIRAAELTDGVIEGTVKDAELDAALRNREIDGSQFIAVRKLLKAEEKESALEDDPHVVLGFTEKVELGTLTTNEVINAFADKQITRATMDRLRKEIDAGPDDFRTKEQRRLLRENVGGLSGLGAILGEKATRKVNDAVQEYNERTRGPDKEDPLVVRQDIESRAAEPRSLESFFRPRFMVGPKGGAGNKETMDVRETRKATAKALRDGRITPAEAAREVQLIKDIEAARARQ